MMTDWQELNAIARRTLRYDAEQVGRCPLCQCGPTHVDGVLGVTWLRCAPCAVRWPRVDWTAPDTDLDDLDHIRRQLDAIADCEDADTFASRRIEP